LNLAPTHGGALALLEDLYKRQRQWDRYVEILVHKQGLGTEDPYKLAEAYREVLRYEPAGSGSPRVATETFRHRDLEIPAGLIALPSAPSANRDPEVYPDPDRFDVTRRHPEPQLTFGGGVHYCLGASLARAELQEALPILARRLPQLEADGPVAWRTQVLIRGPARLPIGFAAPR